LSANTGAALLGHGPVDLDIILPFGISFFTLQQVMFLVDSYRGEVPRCGMLDYPCFVGFFAHLIAGPIVRPRDIIPQFAEHDGRVHQANLVAGADIFFAGSREKIGACR
jgi:D-alanyl-lipoteichoic acid acyltransferase DltB (MBOAT superfamily)